MHINLCPKMVCCSFTVIIVLVDIFVYILSLSIDPVSNREFLAPDAKALEHMGWLDAKKIKGG